MEHRTKKTEQHAAPQGLWARTAQSISHIANPLFVAIPTFLLVALKTAPSISQAFLWWGVIVIGISVAPFLFVWRGVRRGNFTDSLLSMREQRIGPMLFGLACASAVFLALYLLGASRALMVTILTILVGGMITLLITRYWKISLHLVGMTGSVTVLTLVYGPLFLLLSPLIPLIGWARWYVHAHTFFQALAGSTLAVSITLTLFWLFGLL